MKPVQALREDILDEISPPSEQPVSLALALDLNFSILVNKVSDQSFE